MFNDVELERRSNTPLLIAAGLSLVVAVAFVSGLLYAVSSAQPEVTTRSSEPPFEEKVRDSVLSYLANPHFSGDGFSRQVLGDARLEVLQLRDRQAYFSLPEPAVTPEAVASATATFIADRTKIEFARDVGGRLRLGEYHFVPSRTKAVYFRTGIDNLRFETDAVLSFPFERATYTVSMAELEAFSANESIYGGRIYANTGTVREGRPLIVCNHGAFVGRAGEPSLQRLAEALVADIPADDPLARERRVQRLLDFVSQEIEYDEAEASYDVETLKRPNEVLMSGRADCSNKSILLGSLLEQIGEEYLLVYLPRHITVAVRAGRFEMRNGLAVEYEQEPWLVAESTVPGFRIGLDRVKDERSFRSVMFVQEPRRTDVIVRLSNMQELEFE